MDLSDVLKPLCAEARQAIYVALEGARSDLTNARLACAALRGLIDEQVPEMRFKLDRLKPDELASLCGQSCWLTRWPLVKKALVSVSAAPTSDTHRRAPDAPAMPPPGARLLGLCDAASCHVASSSKPNAPVMSAAQLTALVAQMEGVQELSIEGLAFSASEVRALLEALPFSVRQFSVDEVEPEEFAISCALAHGKVVSVEMRTLHIPLKPQWVAFQGEQHDTDFDALATFVDALLPPSRVAATRPRCLSTTLVAPTGTAMPRFGPKFRDLVSRCEETRLDEVEPEVCYGPLRAKAAAVMAAAEQLGVPRAFRWRWWWFPRGETIRVALRPPAPTGPTAPSVGLGSGGSPIDAPGVVQLAVQRMLMSYAPTGSSSGAEAAVGSPPPAASPSAPSHMLLTGPAIAALLGAPARRELFMKQLKAAVVAACTPAASGAACSQQQAPAAAPAAEAVTPRAKQRETENVLRYRELPWAHVLELSCGSEAAAAAVQRLVAPLVKEHLSAAAQAAAEAAEGVVGAAEAAALQEAAAAGGVELVPCRLDVTQAIAETLEALWAGEEPGAPGLGVDGLERLRWLLGVWEEVLHRVTYLSAPGMARTRPGGTTIRAFPGGMRVRRLGLWWAES
ncbi:hypothetical protein HYH03_003959 [Edaphochlamys debaryana]|uniref:Uncharacterized protein n=1 Tax=Edaphochlamys debaryana TaxID=47281 RepID=A0A836C3X5_9CHLO|nr:hypothetical protein HYH03_003959 [Edaphochlamys debaryana]|eukprot:KAG2498207.1 hypothetical protein HYH03_003959 [Edaphochlamys debaryana]